MTRFISPNMTLNEILSLNISLNNSVSVDKSKRISLIQSSLDSRALNCLTYNEIYTLEDLTKCRAKDLLQIPNFGKKSLMAINEMLLSFGLSLSNEYIAGNPIELTMTNSYRY